MQQQKGQVSFESNISAKGRQSKSISFIEDPSPQQLQLIQAFLFRIKSDHSYDIVHSSIKLLRAAPYFGDQIPYSKYKPEYFAFRCWNKVTQSSIIFMKVQNKQKIFADRLYFFIGRSKFRNLAQVVDIFSDFNVPEMFDSPQPKLYENYSEQSVSQRQNADSKIITPSSWADQTSNYFWIASQDFVNSQDIDTEQTLQNIIRDKSTQMDFNDSGFAQCEFIFWAKQIASSLAQMQVLGKPHGNVQPRAFGVKCNKIVKLRNLFDDECESQEGLRSCKMSLVYANAFWLDYQEQKQELSPYKSKAIKAIETQQKENRKWGFKDDALALGRILLSMLLIGVIQPLQLEKMFSKNFQIYREDYMKPQSTLKTTQQLIVQKEKQTNKNFLLPLKNKGIYNQKLLTIVFKLLEPEESQRLDAAGAFHYFQNFEDLEDFSFEQELLREVALANERCQSVGKLVGNNIKLQISLNRSNKIRNYFQTPPNQQDHDDMNDSSLIEDYFDPQDFLDSYQHKSLMKEKEKTILQVQKVKEKVEQVVNQFQKLNSQFQSNRDKQQAKSNFKVNQLKFFKINKSLNGYHKLYIEEEQPKQNKQSPQVIRKQNYSGYLKQGKRQGFGVLQCQDFTYIGQFSDDRVHGIGNKTYKDAKFKGDQYTGEFDEGYRHGYGHYSSNNRQQIYGIWHKDKGVSYQLFEKHQASQKLGKQKIIERYQGKRQSNKFHGFGILQKFLEQKDTIIGTFQNDMILGYGRHQIGQENNDFYEGDLKQSDYNGFGC